MLSWPPLLSRIMAEILVPHCSCSGIARKGSQTHSKLEYVFVESWKLPYCKVEMRQDRQSMSLACLISLGNSNTGHRRWEMRDSFICCIEYCPRKPVRPGGTSQCWTFSTAFSLDGPASFTVRGEPIDFFNIASSASRVFKHQLRYHAYAWVLHTHPWSVQPNKSDFHYSRAVHCKMRHPSWSAFGK